MSETSSMDESRKRQLVVRRDRDRARRMRLGTAGSVGAGGEGQDERMDSSDAPRVCAVFLLPVLRMVPRCDDRQSPIRRAKGALATGVEETSFAARPPAVGASVGLADAAVAKVSRSSSSR